MKRFYLLFAFDFVVATLVGVIVIPGYWTLAPVLLLITLAINFAVIVSARPVPPGTSTEANRKFRNLAYACMFVAALNSLSFVEGWSWMSLAAVLGPLLIGGLLLRLADKIGRSP